MKILIALNEDKNKDSKLSYHFGICKFFGIYNTENKNLEITPNFIDHSKSKSAVDQILEKNIDTVFSLGMGQKAINLFKDKNVTLKTGEFKTLNEVLENINNLKDLTTSCNH